MFFGREAQVGDGWWRAFARRVPRDRRRVGVRKVVAAARGFGARAAARLGAARAPVADRRDAARIGAGAGARHRSRQNASARDQAEDPDLQRAAISAELQSGERGLVDLVREARLRKDENLLVIVDQFEDLLRYGAGAIRPNTRARRRRSSSCC